MPSFAKFSSLSFVKKRLFLAKAFCYLFWIGSAACAACNLLNAFLILARVGFGRASGGGGKRKKGESGFIKLGCAGSVGALSVCVRFWWSRFRLNVGLEC